MRRRVRRVMTWGVAMLAVLSPGASSAAEESETLLALLQEVRLLRQAMERNTEFASRTQLLTAQLSVQETASVAGSDRVGGHRARASGDRRRAPAIPEHPGGAGAGARRGARPRAATADRVRPQADSDADRADPGARAGSLISSVARLRDRRGRARPLRRPRQPPVPARSGSWRGVASRYCGFCSPFMPMRASHSSGSS